MPLGRVQATAKGGVDGPSVNVPAFAAPPTIGNGLIVFANMAAGGGGSVLGTCTDNRGNTYVLAKSQIQATGFIAGVFFCPRIVNTGAPFTITLTNNPGDFRAWTVSAVEVSGVGTGLVVDQVVGAGGVSLAPSTGATAALTGAESLQAALFHMSGGSTTAIVVGGASPVWGEEFENFGADGHPGGEADTRIVGAAGGTTPSASWTVTGASAAWSAVLVAFKSGGSLGSAYADRVIADGASRYFRLGEPSGLVAVDAAGGGNGTISASGVTYAQPGALVDADTAMLFNNTGPGFISMPQIAAPLSCTMEGWIKLTANLGSITPILSLQDAGVSGQTLTLYQQGGTPCVTIGVSGGAVGANRIALGAWYHVVAVLNGSTAVFYVNGVAAGSAALARTVVNSGGLARIANWPGLGALSGSLDEVAFYPRELSAADVAAHYALATTAATPTGGWRGFPWSAWVDGATAMERYTVWKAIVPNNVTNLPGGVTHGIWVGTGGDIAAVMRDDTVATFTAVPAGCWLPIGAKRINVTGTTASNLLAIYQV